MIDLIGATSVKVCNVQWGFLVIILAYIAFLCYWMVFKKKRELDLVSVIGSSVFFLIGFIMSFFARCPVCYAFMIVALVILCAFVGYHLYYAVIAFIKNRSEENEAVVVEEKKEAPVVISETPAEEVVASEVQEEGASLKESFSIMDALVTQSRVTKASIYQYLSSTYGDKVVLNSRPNRTKNDRLPMADTHFALVDGKKVCFVYVYQNATGGVLLLVKTNKLHFKMIADRHEGVKRSAFPRRGEWYSIIVDDGYTEAEIYKILSDSYEICQDSNFQPVDRVFQIVSSVDAADVSSLVPTDAVNAMIQKSQRKVDKKKKGHINIGLINQYFNENETVTLEEIKKRIPVADKNMTYCKVLAQGVLNKPLTVDLDDYSIDAAKMILVTGGKVLRPQK